MPPRRAPAPRREVKPLSVAALERYLRPITYEFPDGRLSEGNEISVITLRNLRNGTARAVTAQDVERVINNLRDFQRGNGSVLVGPAAELLRNRIQTYQDALDTYNNFIHSDVNNELFQGRGVYYVV